MKKIIILLLVIFIIVVAGCSPVKKPKHPVVLDTKFILFGITKTSQSTFPNGMLYFEIVVFNKDKTPLKNPRYVKEIKIIDPEGSTFYNVKISPYQRKSMKFVYSGYLYSQKNYYFVGYTFSYTAKDRPKPGVYKFKITSITGHETVKNIRISDHNDPIKGFPIRIRYNKSLRMVTWKGTKGQAGYRVIIVKGNMGRYIDLRRIVYFSNHKKGELITKTSHVIPDYVKFKRGHKYHIVVVSHTSKDNTFERQFYLHMQDKHREIANFIAS